MKEVFEMEASSEQPFVFNSEAEDEIRKNARGRSSRTGPRYLPATRRRPIPGYRRRPVVRQHFPGIVLPQRCWSCGALPSLDPQPPCGERVHSPDSSEESFFWLPSFTPSRIIDLTNQAEKSQRKAMRDLRKVDTLVLHQMACCFYVKDPLTRFLQHFAPHFAILPDGRILQLHPVEALTWASNDFNSNSVAVEFAGNFPDTRGKWWLDRETLQKLTQAQAQAYINANQNQLTQQQIEAGRYLVQHLIDTMGLKKIVAHRQSSNQRDNDPGPDVWYHVGQWAIDNHGLSDGGPGYKVGTGYPIPDLWRNWGKISKP